MIIIEIIIKNISKQEFKNLLIRAIQDEVHMSVCVCVRVYYFIDITNKLLYKSKRIQKNCTCVSSFYILFVMFFVQLLAERNAQTYKMIHEWNRTTIINEGYHESNNSCGTSTQWWKSFIYTCIRLFFNLHSAFYYKVMCGW